MSILISMAIGLLIGLKLFPKKLEKWNSIVQTFLTAVLIFSMGVTLGSRENFITELKTLGFKSLVYALIPIATSVLLVYLLTEKFLKKRK